MTPLLGPLWEGAPPQAVGGESLPTAGVFRLGKALSFTEQIKYNGDLMKTLAILYICTGPYAVFWHDFYPNFQGKFPA